MFKLYPNFERDRPVQDALRTRTSHVSFRLHEFPGTKCPGLRGSSIKLMRDEVRPRDLMIGPRDTEAMSLGTHRWKAWAWSKQRYVITSKPRGLMWWVQVETARGAFLKRTIRWVEHRRCFKWSADLAQDKQEIHMGHLDHAGTEG